VEGRGGGAAVVAGEAETVLTGGGPEAKQLRRSVGRGPHLAVSDDARRVVAHSLRHVSDPRGGFCKC